MARPGGCGTEARRASASRIGGHVSHSRERAVQRGSVGMLFRNGRVFSSPPAYSSFEREMCCLNSSFCTVSFAGPVYAAVRPATFRPAGSSIGAAARRAAPVGGGAAAAAAATAGEHRRLVSRPGADALAGLAQLPLRERAPLHRARRGLLGGSRPARVLPREGPSPSDRALSPRVPRMRDGSRQDCQLPPHWSLHCTV